MNFDFPDELKMLKDEARKVLVRHCPRSSPRAILDGPEPFDRKLWQEIGKLGWVGRIGAGGVRRRRARPSRRLRAGRGVRLCDCAGALCLDRLSVRSRPCCWAARTSSRRRYLPGLASGETIGTLALAERLGAQDFDSPHDAPGRRPADRRQARGARRRCRRPRHRRRQRHGARARAVPRRSRRRRRRARDRARPSIRPARTPRSRSTARRPRLCPMAAGCRRHPPPDRPRRHHDGVRAGRRRAGRTRHGPRLCPGALCLRPPDRLVPGDQAQARRHLRRRRARPLQRLLRRLGALDRTPPSCRSRPPSRASPPATPAGSPPRRTSRPTAAWATPGRATRSSTIAAPSCSG